jgi:hypothetical protein
MFVILLRHAFLVGVCESTGRIVGATRAVCYV